MKLDFFSNFAGQIKKTIKKNNHSSTSGFEFQQYKFKRKICYDENADSDFLQEPSWAG